MVRTNNTYASIIIKIIIIATVIFFNTSINQADTPDTVAVIGNRVITAEEYADKFGDKINQIGISDNFDIRIKYLDNLMKDELLIIKARQLGLDKTEESKLELKRIKLQELLNAYTQKILSPQIDIDENELRKLFLDINTKLHVSHLYAATLDEANYLYSLLRAGKSFEELATEIFEDPLLKNNGGSLGFITIDEMDPQFEKTAYSLKVGEISKPVKTVKGYSIIKLNEIKKNPLITEYEYLKVKDRLIRLARKREFESLAASLTENLTHTLNIRFNESFISKLFMSLKIHDMSTESAFTMNSTDLDKIIVNSELGEWSLEMVIQEIKLTTPKMRNWIRSVENLRDFIGGLVTRKYIWMEALNSRLDATESYKRNVASNFDTYLMGKVEELLNNKINIKPVNIEQYYLRNRNHFMTEPEIRLSSILLDSFKSTEEVILRLSNGESFESLSRLYSLQSETSPAGGDMGFFKRKDLDELADTLFSLKPGEWSGPFKDENKYVLLKCTEIKQPYYISLEESSEQIRQSLTSMERIKLRDQYIKDISGEISVKSFPEKLKSIKVN